MSQAKHPLTTAAEQINSHIDKLTEVPEEVRAVVREEIVDVLDNLYDAAIARTQAGVQEVIVHPEHDPFPQNDVFAALADEMIEHPFMRISWASDRGDPSVGIPGWNSWTLNDNQEGTALKLAFDRMAARMQHLRSIQARLVLAIQHGDQHGWATARSELDGILGSDYFAGLCQHGEHEPEGCLSCDREFARK